MAAAEVEAAAAAVPLNSTGWRTTTPSVQRFVPLRVKFVPFRCQLVSPSFFFFFPYIFCSPSLFIYDFVALFFSFVPLSMVSLSSIAVSLFPFVSCHSLFPYRVGSFLFVSRSDTPPCLLVPLRVSLFICASFCSPPRDT